MALVKDNQEHFFGSNAQLSFESNIFVEQDQNTETENKRFEEAFPPKKFE